MRSVALLATLVMFGASAPGFAVEETAEGFSAAMQGCWNRAGSSSQMCLDGGLAGVLTVTECQTHGDLTECSTQEGRYEFKDEKFWRSYDDGPLAGGVDNCDVMLEADKRVELHNCQWTIEPTLSATAEDAVYERAGDQ